jgi:hypothetical protein
MKNPQTLAHATTVSLVLGSGGARGLAHIGVIHWLSDNGYNIRSIAGSSIGALVGGIYAASKLEVYADRTWPRTCRAGIRDHRPLARQHLSRQVTMPCFGLPDQCVVVRIAAGRRDHDEHSKDCCDGPQLHAASLGGPDCRHCRAQRIGRLCDGAPTRSDNHSVRQRTDNVAIDAYEGFRVPTGASLRPLHANREARPAGARVTSSAVDAISRAAVHTLVGPPRSNRTRRPPGRLDRAP